MNHHLVVVCLKDELLIPTFEKNFPKTTSTYVYFVQCTDLNKNTLVRHVT